MNDTRESETSRALRDRLGCAVGAVRSLQPVTGGGAQGADVWRAVLASGAQVAVKRHLHAGAGAVEFGVLRMLHRLGAPVAPPLHWDPQQRLLITQWVGTRTLTAAIQGAAARPAHRPHDLRQLTNGLLKGIAALETAFQGLGARLPLDETSERQRRHAEVRARCHRAPETFARLANSCNLAPPPGWATSLRAAWAAVAAALCAGRLTFGGRDCTPRNVLTDGAAVWFIDFAVIGLDWPEARLAQYAAAVGGLWEADSPSEENSPCKEGQSAPPPLRSLLTHGERQWYGESGCIESALLDMHHLLLWSEAVRLLLDGKWGTVAPHDGRLRERLGQALQLALFPLAPETPAEPVRALLSVVFAHVSLSDSG